MAAIARKRGTGQVVNCGEFGTITRDEVDLQINEPHLQVQQESEDDQSGPALVIPTWAADPGDEFDFLTPAQLSFLSRRPSRTYTWTLKCEGEYRCSGMPADAVSAPGREGRGGIILVLDRCPTRRRL